MNTPVAALERALALIEATPSYERVAQDLRRTRLRLAPELTDRAQISLRGTITLGLEPFAGVGKAVTVSLAGTLVHEQYHTHQNPLLKTRSFWLGLATRTHPMRRYELPAYAAQRTFLLAIARTSPDFAADATREADAVQSAFAAHYGLPGLE